ncbi:uncharacterized protein LOC108023622 [Drosophila biarmipes]|uniref:uncharacterized protein LOC108023622 n=1 Tax=Drosophila biarmipes TaxID=125945 RepID=UPI0007E5F451|nr:uncharacterized protein LOC108023622 [Drosophila biarmipes]
MNTVEEECSSLSYNSNPVAEIERDPEVQSQSPSQSQSASPSQFQTPGPQTGARKRKETPIRVRDMINLYNFATQKNQELEQAKSLYFGSISKSEEEQGSDLEGGNSSCNMSLLEDKEKAAVNGGQGTLRVTTSINDDNSADSNAVEKSYQSKTTIRRTSQGVRIIIDIFFDKKESEIDIVGSRVETDIPESRILTDFQQHSLAMKNQEQKPGVQEGPSAPSA